MPSHDPERPNILFVLTDDQGAWAMGCAGNAEIHTPNLDRIAATGVRCDNFFCASPVCSPARASSCARAARSRPRKLDHSCATILAAKRGLLATWREEKCVWGC